MNPYAPPSSLEVIEREFTIVGETSTDDPRKGSQIVGTVVFACAFLILGDAILQPLFNSLLPIRYAHVLGPLVGSMVGVLIGFPVCRCLQNPQA